MGDDDDSYDSYEDEIFDEEMVNSLFYLVDLDRSGRITLKEWTQHVRNPMTHKKMVEILGGDYLTIQTFKEIDHKNKMVISLNQFTFWCRKHLMHKLGGGSSDHQEKEEEPKQAAPTVSENVDGSIPRFGREKLELIFDTIDVGRNGE